MAPHCCKANNRSHLCCERATDDVYVVSTEDRQDGASESVADNVVVTLMQLIIIIISCNGLFWNPICIHIQCCIRRDDEWWMLNVDDAARWFDIALGTMIWWFRSGCYDAIVKMKIWKSAAIREVVRLINLFICVGEIETALELIEDRRPVNNESGMHEVCADMRMSVDISLT